jgi:uncharacterized protein (TIGR04255 family)
MPINFKKKSEVRLKKAPLHEVICQIKFSPILSIAREVPVEFQELVRIRFPRYEALQNFVLQIPGAGSTENAMVDLPPKSHHFKASDEKSFISLAADSVALSTKDYEHWSSFVKDLQIAENATIQVYKPPTATRIGLRFINRFTKKNTGCSTTQELLSLFRNELTCLVRAEPWAEPKEMFTQLILTDGKAKLAIRTGFGKDRETTFILDFDYYEEDELSLEKLYDRVNRYHDRIYDAFRWCVNEESLARFDPVS